MKLVSPAQSLREESLLPRSNKVGVSNFYTLWLMKLILHISSSAATVSLLLPQEMVGGTTVPSLFRDLPNLYQIFLISTVFAFVGAFNSLMVQHKPRVERFFRIIAVASILFALAIVYSFVGAVSNFFTLGLEKLLLSVSSSAATVSLLLPKKMVVGKTVPSLFIDLPNLYQIFLISTLLAFVGAFSYLMIQHKPRVKRFFRIIAVASILFALAIVYSFVGAVSNFFTLGLEKLLLSVSSSAATVSLLLPKKMVVGKTVPSLFIDLPNLYQIFRISALLAFVGAFSYLMIQHKPGAGIKSKDDDAGDSEDERQTSRNSAGSSSPEPVKGNRQITDQMENSGSVQGQDGGATPDIDPTPHIGSTGGIPADDDDQEASLSRNNGISQAGSGNPESGQSTGSGGTDTVEEISSPRAGDVHGETDRDEGDDGDRPGDRDLERASSSSEENSSNKALVATFITIVVQSTTSIIALSFDGLSPRAQNLFTGVLFINLVGFVCLYVALSASIIRRASNILVRVGGAAAAFGFLLMLAVKLSLGIIIPACVVVLAAFVSSFKR